MALSQSALLEVLDALKAGESVEMIRDAVQVILQELLPARPLLISCGSRQIEPGSIMPKERRYSISSTATARQPCGR